MGAGGTVGSLPGKIFLLLLFRDSEPRRKPPPGLGES